MQPANCILLLGGKGSRFDSGLPKQFHKLSGEPMFMVTARQLISHLNIFRLVISAPQEYLADPLLTGPLKDLENEAGCEIIVAAGGNSRHESLVNVRALIDPGCKVTIVHDANRPYLERPFLERVIQASAQIGEFDALVPVLPMVDSVCRLNEKGEITVYEKREQLARLQTPQLCSTARLLSLSVDLKSPPTDEGSWFLQHGLRVGTFTGDSKNQKVTFKEDLVV